MVSAVVGKYWRALPRVTTGQLVRHKDRRRVAAFEDDSLVELKDEDNQERAPLLVRVVMTEVAEVELVNGRFCPNGVFCECRGACSLVKYSPTADL